MKLNYKQLDLVSIQLNKIIKRCLWEPSGDPGTYLLKRATAAYLCLRALELPIRAEEDVIDVLSGGNSDKRDYLKELR